MDQIKKSLFEWFLFAVEALPKKYEQKIKMAVWILCSDWYAKLQALPIHPYDKNFLDIQPQEASEHFVELDQTSRDAVQRYIKRCHLHNMLPHVLSMKTFFLFDFDRLLSWKQRVRSKKENADLASLQKNIRSWAALNLCFIIMVLRCCRHWQKSILLEKISLMPEPTMANLVLF